MTRYFFSTIVILQLAVMPLFVEALGAESINERIVQFCRDKIGESIGRGECTDLANAALESARATSHSRWKDSPGEGDYVWGSLVLVATGGMSGATFSDDLAKVQGGDIIQFRDVRFEGKNSNGKGAYWLNSQHHTAIVVSVNQPSRELTIYHQNWGGVKTVARKTLKLGDIRLGWLRFYRPQPDSSRSPERSNASSGKTP